MFPYRVWSYVVHSLSWEPLRMKLFSHTKPNCSWTCLKGRLKTIHAMTNLKQVQVRGAVPVFLGHVTLILWVCRFIGINSRDFWALQQLGLNEQPENKNNSICHKTRLCWSRSWRRKKKKKSLYCKSDCVEVMLGICSNHNQILIHFLHKWLKTPSSLLN